MTQPDSLLNRDWQATVEKLGGAAELAVSARQTDAFRRARAIPDAVVLLRLVLAYCLGKGGLRLTAAWAAAVGLADISNVGLLYRLRQCEAWLQHLVGRLLSSRVSAAAQGRLIRLVDATTLPKAARTERCRNGVWRIHSAFDLPHERFGHFALTDEAGGEHLDRAPVIKGEIRIGDSAYVQPDRIAAVLAGGGDVLVRVAWRNGRWLDETGAPFNFIAAFKTARTGRLDGPVWLHRKRADPLPLRLVATRLPPHAREAARQRVRRSAQKSGYSLSADALIAAEWVVLVTSLPRDGFAGADVLALYRLRWRVELAFKRLKSVIGLRPPPSTDQRSARAFILAHLLVILLLEPLVDAFEDSPHWAEAA